MADAVTVSALRQRMIEVAVPPRTLIRRRTRSQPRSLLSIVRLNLARSRM